jgi:hypothetical protein
MTSKYACGVAPSLQHHVTHALYTRRHDYEARWCVDMHIGAKSRSEVARSGKATPTTLHRNKAGTKFSATSSTDAAMKSMSVQNV